MPRIAVVDDQSEYLQIIEQIINTFYFNQGKACTVNTFLKSELLVFEINDSLYYDIYFLDIEMPEINGLRLAQKIRKVDANGYIVFISSHLKYLSKGYDYFAYQYISKSNLKEKLLSTLASLYLKMELDKEEFYPICTNCRYEKILYKEIYCIFKEGKNVTFATMHGNITFRETLKNTYFHLNNKEFFYVDRGFIVNIIHVMKYQNNIIYLRNGQLINVSRTYVDKVKEMIHNYWKGQIK